MSETSVESFQKLQAMGIEHSPEELKSILGLKRKPKAQVFKSVGPDNRIYPGYFTPVLVVEGGKRQFKYMRYRVRPQHSLEEIPSQYNVFNARLDSLEKRKTWKNIFMKNHGLLPFVKFYEWVEVKEKKQLVAFKAKEREIMWAPILYDSWASANNEIQFQSFAVITTDPPKEIRQAGHDRCPIFLKESLIEKWLHPQEIKMTDAYRMLNQQEAVTYTHEPV